METEDSAPHEENHPVDSDILDGCNVKIHNALIADLLNSIAYCGSIFPEIMIFLTATKKVIHIATGSWLEPRFKKWFGVRYPTADLFNPHVMVKMDITNIEYQDQSFDVFYCSHVLEHILDGKKAIRKFSRVLKDNGWSILLVLIYAEKTFEDPSKVEPAERLKAFEQEDHVRRYGPDYINIHLEIGFRVELTKFIDFVQRAEAIRMG